MTADDTREALPPGPYRLVGPDHQGGLFEVWGHQGTPPDFTDGWAIPFVAKGPQGAMEWLLAALAAARRDPPVPPEPDLLLIDTASEVAATRRDPEPVASADAAAAAADRWQAEAAYQYELRMAVTKEANVAIAALAECEAAIRGTEAGLDVERLASAVQKVLDVGRVQCRCGRWPLLENWANHRMRKDGRPHRQVQGQAATIIAAEYARLASADKR